MPNIIYGICLQDWGFDNNNWPSAIEGDHRKIWPYKVLTLIIFNQAVEATPKGKKYGEG